MFFLILLTAQALECDITMDLGLCLYSGIHIIKPFSRLSGVQGYWTFDDDQCLDYSGLSNHGLSASPAGHSPGISGSSALFSGSNYIEIPSAESISAEVFSISFWLFLEKEETINQTGLRWCPILQKGIDDESSQVYERTPAIFFDREQHMLRVYISTTEGTDFPEGEYLESNAHLPLQRWTHIVVIRTTQKLQLYVNGIFDRLNSTEGWTEPNASPLYVGNTPARLEECPVPLLIDELRYYNREMTIEEIYSEASGALGQIESRFVQFGCAECTLEDANNACNTGYHLCTTIELHSGVYDVVRAMGWYEISPTVWSYNALEDSFDEGVLGLGVCCLDLGY